MNASGACVALAVLFVVVLVSALGARRATESFYDEAAPYWAGYVEYERDPDVRRLATEFTEAARYKRVSSLDVVVYPGALHIRWSSTGGEGRLYLFVDERWERVYLDSGDVVRDGLAVGEHSVVVAVYNDETGPDEPHDYRSWEGEVPCHPGHEADARGVCEPLPCPVENHMYHEMTKSGACVPADPVRCVPGWEADGSECVEVPCPDTADNKKQRRGDGGACEPEEECSDGYVPLEGDHGKGCVRADGACPMVNMMVYERHTDPSRPGDLGVCLPADPPRCVGGHVPLDGQFANGCVPFDYPCLPVDHRNRRRLVFEAPGGGVPGQCVPDDSCADGRVPLDGDIEKGCVPGDTPCDPVDDRLYARGGDGVCRPLDECAGDMHWVTDPTGRESCRSDGDACDAFPEDARGQVLEWRANPYSGLRALTPPGGLVCVATEECADENRGFYWPDLHTVAGPCKAFDTACEEGRPPGDSRAYVWTRDSVSRAECEPSVPLGGRCPSPNPGVIYTFQRSATGVDCLPSACRDPETVPVEGDLSRGCVKTDTCLPVDNVSHSRGPDGFCRSDGECKADGYHPLDGDIEKGCVTDDEPCDPVDNRAYRRVRGECRETASCVAGYVPLDGVVSRGCVPASTPCDPIHGGNFVRRERHPVWGHCEESDECVSGEYVFDRTRTECRPRDPDCPVSAFNKIQVPDRYGDCVTKVPFECAPGYVKDYTGQYCLDASLASPPASRTSTTPAEYVPRCEAGEHAHNGSCFSVGEWCDWGTNGDLYITAAGACEDLRCAPGFEKRGGACVMEEEEEEEGGGAGGAARAYLPDYSVVAGLGEDEYVDQEPLAAVSAFNEEQCARFCSEDPACRAFTYYTSGGIGSTNRNCALLDPAGPTFKAGSHAWKRHRTRVLKGVAWSKRPPPLVVDGLTAAASGTTLVVSYSLGNPGGGGTPYLEVTGQARRTLTATSGSGSEEYAGLAKSSTYDVRLYVVEDGETVSERTASATVCPAGDGHAECREPLAIASLTASARGTTLVVGYSFANAPAGSGSAFLDVSGQETRPVAKTSTGAEYAGLAKKTTYDVRLYVIRGGETVSERTASATVCPDGDAHTDCAPAAATVDSLSASAAGTEVTVSYSFGNAGGAGTAYLDVTGQPRRTVSKSPASGSEKYSGLERGRAYSVKLFVQRGGSETSKREASVTVCPEGDAHPDCAPATRFLDLYSEIGGLGDNEWIDMPPLGGAVCPNGTACTSEGVVAASSEEECAQKCSEADGCRAFTFYKRGGYFSTGKRCKLMDPDSAHFQTGTNPANTYASWVLKGVDWTKRPPPPPPPPPPTLNPDSHSKIGMPHSYVTQGYASFAVIGELPDRNVMLIRSKPNSNPTVMLYNPGSTELTRVEDSGMSTFLSERDFAMGPEKRVLMAERRDFSSDTSFKMWDIGSKRWVPWKAYESARPLADMEGLKEEYGEYVNLAVSDTHQTKDKTWLLTKKKESTRRSMWKSSTLKAYWWSNAVGGSWREGWTQTLGYDGKAMVASSSGALVVVYRRFNNSRDNGMKLYITNQKKYPYALGGVGTGTKWDAAIAKDDVYVKWGGNLRRIRVVGKKYDMALLIPEGEIESLTPPESGEYSLEPSGQKMYLKFARNVYRHDGGTRFAKVADLGPSAYGTYATYARDGECWLAPNDRFDHLVRAPAKPGEDDAVACASGLVETNGKCEFPS